MRVGPVLPASRRRRRGALCCAPLAALLDRFGHAPVGVGYSRPTQACPGIRARSRVPTRAGQSIKVTGRTCRPEAWSRPHLSRSHGDCLNGRLQVTKESKSGQKNTQVKLNIIVTGMIPSFLAEPSLTMKQCGWSPPAAGPALLCQPFQGAGSFVDREKG